MRSLQPLLSDPTEFCSCFISYSHEDKPFALKLHHSLRAEGIHCWLDQDQLLPGDDIYRKVDRAIRLWDKVLLCASRHSLTSPWVCREVDTAIEKEIQLGKERCKEVFAIIPLDLDGYLFRWDGSHAASLRKRLAADFTGWETDNDKFDAEFKKLLKALRVADGASEPPPCRNA